MTSVKKKTATENILSLDDRAVTMERIVFLSLFCIAVEGDIGKHIYISESLKWNDAQAYCRQYHTDLSYLNSQSEIDKLRKDAGGNINTGWIGLQRDPNNYTAWIWSGGRHITYENWADGQPNNYKGIENKGIIHPYEKWGDRPEEQAFPFYCMDVTVVEEKMSWEDALINCREKQTDLPSLLSETDLLLSQTAIKKVTERVWIGLRFLGDRWLWVNGDPLEYEAWSHEGGQDHQCPIWKRCGALPKEGRWENWDCQDKLYFICI